MNGVPMSVTLRVADPGHVAAQRTGGPNQQQQKVMAAVTRSATSLSCICLRENVFPARRLIRGRDRCTSELTAVFTHIRHYLFASQGARGHVEIWQYQNPFDD